MIHVWTNRPGRAVLEAGERAEQAEQQADASYDRLQAPPCVACGQPVADKDFERHRYEAHAGNEMVQPFGRPEAREALFLAHDADELAKKVQIWRDRHPGVRLTLAGEGTRYEGRMCWVRYRVLDARGKVAH